MKTHYPKTISFSLSDGASFIASGKCEQVYSMRGKHVGYITPAHFQANKIEKIKNGLKIWVCPFIPLSQSSSNNISSL